MSSEVSILVAILCGFLLGPGRHVHADQSAMETLKVRPSTCVALHKGQRCYARIRVSWTNLDEGRFCLFAVSDDERKQLACWSGMRRDHLFHDYEAADSVDYRLVSEAEGTTVGAATVRTGWVYRSSRRSASGWRLF